MFEVGTRIVFVEIFEHCVSGFPGEALGSNKVCGNGGTIMVRTYPPIDRVPSVGGLGLVMNKYWWGGGGLGTGSKGDSKIEHFNPYGPSLMDS